MKRIVLVISNPLNHEGGITNYYRLLFRYFKSDDFELRHFSIGSRDYLFYYPLVKIFLYPLIYIYDFVRYLLVLSFSQNIKLVQINPSLIPVPLFRDALLIIVARIFRKQIIVFFRGWKINTFSSIREHRWSRSLFKRIYLDNSSLIVVLAKSFRNDVISLGADPLRIIVTTTAVDKNNIINLAKPNTFPINILFMGRIQPEKGVEDLVQAIKNTYHSSHREAFNYTIAGHEYRKGYVTKLKEALSEGDVPESYVKFAGRVEGRRKYELYARSDIFILPSYSEGCPNSVLEALCSGLFCLTTNVGALNDIIVPGFNGEYTGINDPDSVVRELYNVVPVIDELRSRRGEISKDSINKFDIRPIARQFEETYNKILG